MLNVLVGREPAVVGDVDDKIGPLCPVGVGAEHGGAELRVDVLKADRRDETPIASPGVGQMEYRQTVIGPILQFIILVPRRSQVKKQVVQRWAAFLAGDEFAP